MKVLQKHDIQKLESYWLTYRDLVASLESISMIPEESFRQEQTYRITSAIAIIFNESRDTVRHVIQEAYFNPKMNVLDPKHIATEVGCTTSKVNRIRESLMEELAAMIGWV